MANNAGCSLTELGVIVAGMGPRHVEDEQQIPQQVTYSNLCEIVGGIALKGNCAAEANRGIVARLHARVSNRKRSCKVAALFFFLQSFFNSSFFGLVFFNTNLDLRALY